MSDTPRTDAAAIGFGRLLVEHGTPDNPKFETTELVPADFARQLERELSRYVSQPQPPKIQPAVWDGTIRFDSDCIVNGVEIKAGTVWRAGEQFISNCASPKT